jgi:arachidonate 15-lipoxygenase
MRRQPSLPRDDSSAERARALSKARDDYQFDFSYQEIVSAKSVPLREKTDPRYWAAIAKVMAELELNQLATRSLGETVEAAGEAVAEKLVEKLAGTLGKLAPKELAARLRPKPHDPSADPRTPETYERMYARIPEPVVVPYWIRDDAFAWQALAGTNPIMLRRLDAPHPRLPIDEATFARALAAQPGTAPRGSESPDRLEAAMREGRLYVADYAMLEGIRTGTFEGYPKTLFAPIALYVRTKAGPFAPVAIQCGQTPLAAGGAPIFTPADGMSWKMARTTVTCAEGNFQGIVSHFAWCHEVMESVILATHRTLAPWHPLHVLLAPHFDNTLITNDIAMTSLIGPGGNMERLQSGVLEDSLDLAKRMLKGFRLSESAPTEDFAARGVDDLEALPDYPFRDDGLLTWPLLRTWARDYLRLYYTDDAAVEGDTELAAWIDELGSNEGGRLAGLTRLRTFDALAELVARILFRCTVYHAAFNYTSYDFYGYAPNVQTATFGPGPTGGPADTEAALQAMWPPYQAAYDTMHLFYTIFRVQLNRVGHYPDGHFEDPRVAPLEAALRAGLDEVERTIAARDGMRLIPYPYLKPSRVSNSIHV